MIVSSDPEDKGGWRVGISDILGKAKGWFMTSKLKHELKENNKLMKEWVYVLIVASTTTLLDIEKLD